jgi:hypothetical protein
MDIRELKVPGVRNINNTFLKHGVYIASRRGLFCGIALFQVEDYYVEIFYNKKTNEVGRVKTFHGTELLEPYLKHIDISEICG